MKVKIKLNNLLLIVTALAILLTLRHYSIITSFLNPVNSNYGASDEDQLRSKHDENNTYTSTNMECPYKSSLEHELALREVLRVSNEFWRFIRQELDKIQNGTKTESTLIHKVSDIQRTFQNDLYKLSETVDNVSEWRNLESRKLADLVRKRIDYLQNPKDCSSASKIFCDLSNACGFGCQLHHVTHCLLAAYATQRTLILNSDNLPYTPGGWTTLFKPLTGGCNVTLSSIPVGIDETKTVFKLQEIGYIKNRPSYFPLAIPEDLATNILRFHSKPAVWWIGQFVRYATRPNKDMQKLLDDKMKELGFDHPIVGVHVRRTDKLIWEAKLYAVEVYMKHVEEWFKVEEYRHPGIQRKIYLASDEPTVFEEIKAKYPNYTVINNRQATDFAKTNRWTEQSLRGIYTDIHLLSLCNYIVCTFSSNVCRVVYELMQTYHGDASGWFNSLDAEYYFHGQHPNFFEAVENHTANNNEEISFSKGHIIDVIENRLDGYSKGKLNDTGKVGLFPSHKVRDWLRIVKIPEFPKI